MESKCYTCDLPSDIPCQFCSESKTILDMARWPALEVKLEPMCEMVPHKMFIGSGEDVCI